jgi:soluble lytic murein transglycosylase
MLKRATFFLLFLSIWLPAKNLTVDFFNDKPRSFIKDFYISQFLDQDIKPKEAEALVGQVNNMNLRLFYKFADKVDDFGFKRVKYCMKLKANQFKGKDADCVAMGLSAYKATSLNEKELKTIANSIHYRYPQISKTYNLIASKSFKKLIASDDKTLIKTFTSVGGKFRRTYYNQPIPAQKLISLATNRSFSTMAIKIARDDKLDKLQTSILKLDSSKLSAEANFLLGLNAVKHNKEDVAIWYFKLSSQKAKMQFDKDKAIFWSYLISKKSSYLQTLADSKDINIYTLYANETLGLEPRGIVTSLNPKKEKAPFEISDPFAWVKVKNLFKSQHYESYEAKKRAAYVLNSKESEAHVARLIYKFQLENHYFFMPYFDSLKHLDKKRIAMILSLARQESRFIPTVVSYSYALGLMQFMPYVARDIAKKNGFKNFQPEDMFKPSIAYKFADIHLNYLENALNHPLFVAYAYNGGLGFTQRKILNKGYFKEGSYEPFMSLEMVPNQQARHYGKKVLANYVIYSKLLGIDTTIKTILNTLIPSRHN